MSDRTTGPSWLIRLRSALLAGREPAPLDIIVRQPYYPWVVVGTTCIGAFIGQLDASIVQLVLPTLEHDFAARLSAVSWVAIGYQLAFAAILPVFARLAEIVGRKLMYLTGFALFGLASFLCGLAANLEQLIAFRVLLGVAGAMAGANSIVILLRAAGPNRRGRALGLYAAAQAVGISVGPITGGILLATLGWRWVFWVNVPFAVTASVIGWLVFPQTTGLDADRRFDWRGALLLMPGLASLLALISESFAWGPTSPIIIACGIAAIALLLAFVHQERRTPAPLIDLGLFRIVAFASGIVAIVMSYALLYGMFFLMSFALVRGYHETALAAGFRLAIIPIALGVVAPFSGALHTRLGARGVLLGGMAICTAALILLSNLLTNSAAGVEGIMIALGIFGAGLGIFIAPNNNATMSAAPDRRSGEAAGLLNLMRVFGCSLGVACASAVLAWRLAVHTGIGDSTLGAPREGLLAGVNDGVWLLVAFAVISGITSVLRQPPRTATIAAT